MKLLEHEAKAHFRGRGIAVPPTGGVVKDLKGLSAALKRAGKGPWVVKAQVLAGGRGKAGGIKLAKTPAEARAAAKAMLGMRLVTPQTGARGLVVREVLIDKAAEIERELFLSIVMDRRLAAPVVVASAEGGVEIEILAQNRPEAILREAIDPASGLDAFQARRLAFALGLKGSLVNEFVSMAVSLCRFYLEIDASLVEVNPLIVTKEGRLVALDAKVSTDDNALFRQEGLSERGDLEASAAEREARRVGISYIGLDGDIGCLVNGAGLAMATMDSVKLAGGEPANFLDVGGGASAEQVKRAFRILLGDPRVRAVLVNIFGGIMRCTTIAEGMITALKGMKLKVPLVVRLEGTMVEEGRSMLGASGIRLVQAESLWDAAQKAVAAGRKGNGA